MRYIGRISGLGMITSGGSRLVRTSYAFDGFVKNGSEVFTSGEIRLPAAFLKAIFGRKDIELAADDGRLMALRFSDKKIADDSDSAHVDVTGDVKWQVDLRNPHAGQKA